MTKPVLLAVTYDIEFSPHRTVAKNDHVRPAAQATMKRSLYQNEADDHCRKNNIPDLNAEPGSQRTKVSDGDLY